MALLTRFEALRAGFCGRDQSAEAELGPPVESDDNDLSDSRLVTAMLDAVGSWSEWCHRRIDRYEPTGGNRGRIKHSIDMTLPADPSFAYVAAERDVEKSSDVSGLVVAPIAVVIKAPLHEFDVAVQGVGSVPTLTREQNEQLCSAMLIMAYERSLGAKPGQLDAALVEALHEVVGHGPDAKTVATELTDWGYYGDERILDPSELDPFVATLTKDLAQGFLMCLLLPASALGARSLVRISWLWRTTDTGVARARQLTRSMHQFSLPMTAPSDAASYHFEFVVPEGVFCSAVEIPEGRDGPERSTFVGFKDTTVHLHARYDEAPEIQDARIELTSVRSPAHFVALGSLFATYLICWGLVFFADAGRVSETGVSGVSLLLSFPALLFGLSASRHGSTLADGLARPYKWLTLFCGIALFVFAALPIAIGDGDDLRRGWMLVAYVVTAVLMGAIIQGLDAQMRLWMKFEEDRGS